MVNLELDTHEAIIVLGRITDAALDASLKAAKSHGDQRELLDVTSKVLARVQLRLTDALYPDPTRCDRGHQLCTDSCGNCPTCFMHEKECTFWATFDPYAPSESGAVHRFRPCERCGGSPDIHNTNRGADFIGHEYR